MGCMYSNGKKKNPKTKPQETQPYQFGNGQKAVSGAYCWLQRLLQLWNTMATIPVKPMVLLTAILFQKKKKKAASLDFMHLHHCASGLNSPACLRLAGTEHTMLSEESPAQDCPVMDTHYRHCQPDLECNAPSHYWPPPEQEGSHQGEGTCSLHLLLGLNCSQGDLSHTWQRSISGLWIKSKAAVTVV